MKEKVKSISIERILPFIFLYVVYNYNVLSAITDRKIGSPVILGLGTLFFIIVGFRFNKIKIDKEILSKDTYFIILFIGYLLLNLFMRGIHNVNSWMKLVEFIIIAVVCILIFMYELNRDDIKKIIEIFFIINSILFVILLIRYSNHWLYRMSIGWRISTKGLNATWLGRFLAETAVMAFFALNNKTMKAIYNIILFILIVATGSKSVIIGLLVIYMILMYNSMKKFLEKRKKEERKKIILVVVAISIPILSIALMVFLKYIPMDFIMKRLLSESSYGGAGRTATYAKAIELFKLNPIFGCGIGNYFYQYEVHKFTYPHNIILEFLTELGVVGGIFIVAFLYRLYRCILKIYRDEKVMFLILMALMYFINAMFSGNMTLSNFQFYIFSALIIKFSSKINAQN